MNFSVKKNELLKKFRAVRRKSEEFCQPLVIDDYNMQAMVYGSPPKWNLGHCSWAYEAFVLSAASQNYRPYNEKYYYLFNSYYETVGKRVQRDRRYLLSRPTVDEVFQYRRAVDERITELLERGITESESDSDLLFRLETAINHEEQHQELFFTDLKHIFFHSPLQPTYLARDYELSQNLKSAQQAQFTEFSEVVTEVGFAGNGFCYDNELGRHRVLLNPFALMNRPVTGGEFMEFVESGGYNRFEYWLSDAWRIVQSEEWRHPLYWEKRGSDWWEFTLHGWKKVNEFSPVTHVSFFEADAYARWRGCRLPTEFEWEFVAAQNMDEIEQGHFMDNGYYHSVPESSGGSQPANFFGNVWEWTLSSYLPYPHFKPLAGALGEYNGKFMNDQRVLRGGSCVTPRSHIRVSYRNFFESFQRWQFAGFRLAKDI